MKATGNLIWFVFGGLFWSISAFIAGAFLCVTIIGIPVGLQMFKLAKFVLWPFGKTVTPVNPTGLKKVLNIVWAILFGWMMAVGYLITGLLFCITIIGIPFGYH